MRRFAQCAVLGLCALANLAAQADPQRGVRPPQDAPRRVALVIGNSAYRSGALRNPLNDSRAMCAALKESGFQAQCAENLSHDAFQTALFQFAESMRQGDVAIFYFAGHGFQSEGANYLVPVDFMQASEVQSRQRAVSVRDILDLFGEKKPSLEILILDACRDNPFRAQFSSMRALNSRGLAQERLGEESNLLIAYAAAPGQQADDNGSAANGLYTFHLLQTMRKPGLDLHAVFDDTGDAVKSASGGRQVPWYTGSGASTRFYFKTPAAAPTAAAPSALAAAAMAGVFPGNADAIGATPPFPALPSENPTSEEIFTDDGVRTTPSFSTDSEILAMSPQQMKQLYEDMRGQIGWKDTTGVAKEWWEAFEKQNASQLATLIVLEERLLARKATIAEFFHAYIYSDIDKVESNLYYLDYLNAQRQNYPEYVRSVNFGDVAAKAQKALDKVNPGPEGAAAVEFFKKLKPEKREESASMLWAFQEAAVRGYDLTELKKAYNDSAMEGAVIHSLLFYVNFRHSGEGIPDLRRTPPVPAAKALNEANRFEQALAVLADWLTQNPGDEAGIYQRGSAHLGLKQYQAAIDDFRDITTIHPQNDGAWNALAVTYRLAGQGVEAAAASKKSLDISPKETGYRFELARDYVAAGQSAAAAKELDDVLSEDPKNLAAIFNKIDILLADDKADEMMQLADRAKQIDPASADTLNERCYTYAKAGRAADAIADCEAAVQAKPASGSVIDSRGYAYFKTGRFARALADFNVAVRLSPDLGEAFYHRSLAFVALGDTDRARADLATAHRLGFRMGQFDSLMDAPPQKPADAPGASPASIRFGFNYKFVPRASLIVDDKTGNVAHIAAVTVGSFAALIDLHPGDLLVSINGKALAVDQDIESARNAAQIGSPMVFEILRSGSPSKPTARNDWQKATLKATIPADLEWPAPPPPPKNAPK